MQLIPELWYKVIQTSGVLRFVGHRREGVPIPESQIEGIKKLLSSNAPYTLCPFLRVGQRVRIRGGALDGIEGIFLSRQGQHTLVISVDGIQKSIAVHIPGYDIESL
jgi:transcription antitermination factor NusG